MHKQMNMHVPLQNVSVLFFTATHKCSLYLKSLPWRLPFSGSPGSGQELDACLTPPSFTTQRDRQVEIPTQTG